MQQPETPAKSAKKDTNAALNDDHHYILHNDLLTKIWDDRDTPSMACLLVCWTAKCSV